MAEIRHPNELTAAMELLLKSRIETAAGIEIRKAVEAFEARLRREIATMAMEVSSFYQMETQGQQIVITVKMPKGD